MAGAGAGAGAALNLYSLVPPAVNTYVPPLGPRKIVRPSTFFSPVFITVDLEIFSVHSMPNSPGTAARKIQTAYRAHYHAKRNAAARKIQHAFGKHLYSRKYTNPRNELAALNRRIGELRGKINELGMRLMMQGRNMSQNNKNKLANNRRKVRAELNNLTARRPALTRRIVNTMMQPVAQTTIARIWRGGRARQRLANPFTVEGARYMWRFGTMNRPLEGVSKWNKSKRSAIGAAIRAATPMIQGPQRPTLSERGRMELLRSLRVCPGCRDL